ncbi:cytochrome C oxidase subunit II [Cohnella sp.]|uniref:cytochrome C oxidase subunit II n=1 Tax=Cohnella sp. TaxID=1883426 RepID=UPI003565CEF8
MHKKFAYFLTTVALTLAISACGSGNEKESENSAASPAVSASQEVLIKASNWEFDQQVYTIPKDTPVKLILENLEGAHGFEVVGTDIKIRGNNSEIVTLAAGTYEIKCNIMCGNGHSQMVTKLEVK